MTGRQTAPVLDGLYQWIDSQIEMSYNSIKTEMTMEIEHPATVMRQIKSWGRLSEIMNIPSVTLNRTIHSHPVEKLFQIRLGITKSPRGLLSAATEGARRAGADQRHRTRHRRQPQFVSAKCQELGRIASRHRSDGAAVLCCRARAKCPDTERSRRDRPPMRPPAMLHPE